MRFHTFFFDLDGTLTDSAEGITNSVAYALEALGIDVPDRRVLYPFIGPPLKESFLRYYGITETDRAVRLFREYFVTRGIWENRVFEGIPEALSALKQGGARLGVATSKPEPLARQILERFGLLDFFHVISGASMDESLAEKGPILQIALERAGLRPGDEGAVMIGDRQQDILGARMAGIPAVGVAWGYGSRQELAGAVRILDTPEELPGLLAR